MSRKKFEIVIIPPISAKFTAIERVNLSEIFYHEYFSVELAYEKGHVIFETNLPEWLAHFTVIVKSDHETHISVLMTLSGEKFTGRSVGNLISFSVFDLILQRVVEVCLSRADARRFHAQLCASLMDATRKRYGESVQIGGTDRIKLD